MVKATAPSAMITAVCVLVHSCNVPNKDAGIAEGDVEASVQKMFSSRDTNGDGFLTKAEILSSSSYTEGSALLQEEVDWFLSTDYDRDGLITEREIMYRARKYLGCHDSNNNGILYEDEVFADRQECS